jgi:hypothetical protein
MRFSRILVIAAAVLCAPSVAFATVKSLRILTPELVGLQCTQDDICIDDMARLEEARSLKQEAFRFVNRKVGRIDGNPRFVFCSGLACSKSFGFTNQAAYSFGSYGLVVSPRGWRPYYVRHELIHVLQCERFGGLNALLFKPDWLLEGMAYALSEDPRRPLPQPLEGWRAQFEQWLPTVGRDNLWAAARNVR